MIEVWSTDDLVNPFLGDLAGCGAVDNLPWLISLAVGHLRDGRPIMVNVVYPS